MPPVRVRVISWAALLFLSREATQYSVAILALSWALLALVSAILPRSSKYVLLIMVVATLSTPPSVVVSSSFQIFTYHAPGAAKHPWPTSENATSTHPVNRGKRLYNK